MMGELERRMAALERHWPGDALKLLAAHLLAMSRKRCDNLYYGK